MSRSNDICPDCGQGEIVPFTVKATGERFWMCLECDAVWRPGEDRTVANFFYLSDLLPQHRNAWDHIERVAARPPSQEALLEVVRDGSLGGLYPGMNERDAALVVSPTGPPLPEGPVTLTFQDGRLTGISAPVGGVEWPGLMAHRNPKLETISQDEALRTLTEEGLRPVAVGSDRYEFRTDRFHTILTFADHRLSSVSVSGVQVP